MDGFSNIASSLTPLGNPQNILLWTESRASFGQFVAGTWLPVLLSLGIPYVQGVGNGSQPYSALFVGSVSNIISNVPATQLVLNTVHISAQVAPKIAVEAGLAGNIDPIGSFANLLALQMARRAGLSLRRTVLIQLFVGVVAFLPALL